MNFHEMLELVKARLIAAKDHIRQNPTAIFDILLPLLGFIAPGILFGPLLGLLGFTAAGPALGSVAALLQSVFGTPFLFRVLQSAAMGGFGAGIAATAVRGVIASGAVARLLQNGGNPGEHGGDMVMH